MRSQLVVQRHGQVQINLAAVLFQSWLVNTSIAMSLFKAYATLPSMAITPFRYDQSSSSPLNKVSAGDEEIYGVRNSFHQNKELDAVIVLTTINSARKVSASEVPKAGRRERARVILPPRVNVACSQLYPYKKPSLGHHSPSPDPWRYPTFSYPDA